mmetsp:Transcript_35728/g.83652  ORF Transcript_35728/g.83652 Transcript_35728/m.83652 type:complete len:482 (+) Transcript_35728:64-1509(+)
MAAARDRSRSRDRPGKEASESGDDGDAEELDAAELGSLAMEAMLTGDMERYEELNKRLESKQAATAAKAASAASSSATAVAKRKEQPQQLRTRSGENVVVLEEVDGMGRSRALLESVQAPSVGTGEGPKGQRRRARALKGTAKIGGPKGKQEEGFYADDDISLQELIRRERIQGGPDYNSNLEKHILNNPKFKQLHEDDDEAYALGWYEGKDKMCSGEKAAARQQQKAVMDKKKMHQNLQRCDRCMESERFKREKRQELVISVSPRAYVCMDDFSRSVLPDQVLICPQEHLPAITDLDEDTYIEVRNYQKSLARYFDEQDPPRRVIFVESCIRRAAEDQLLMGAGGHAELVAYPVSMEVFQDAKVYFKKALDEAESEWVTQHKKVIETDPKKGVRAAVPKNFPYVHIDFSLQGGYAHVVEDAAEFPKDFAQQTIAGMCELTVLDRAYTAKGEYKTACEELKRRFKDSGFDWTAGLTSAGAS